MRAFDRQLHQVDDVLHLSIRGISMVQNAPKLVAFLGEFDGTGETEEGKKNLEHAINLGNLAQREIANGFPLLHAQSTILLWSALENVIKDLLTAWLRYEPEAFKSKQISQLKVRLGEYEGLTNEERAEYVVELLERELQAPFRRGVEKFESALETFGFAGSVPDDERKILFELQQVRHVLVHRGGVADRRLLSNCPWLALRPGDSVVVAHATFKEYETAVTTYTLRVFDRVIAVLDLRADELPDGA